MSQTSHPGHQGPYTHLTAEAARDLRRPIAPTEVRFKVQAVRWTGRGEEKTASAAQIVAYIDARTVIARLNLLFPGAWRAQTEALPLEMRLTRRNADGTLTAIPAHRPGRGQGRRHPLLPLPPDDRRHDVRGRRLRRGPQGRLLGRHQARRGPRRDRRVAIRDGLALAARR